MEKRITSTLHESPPPYTDPAMTDGGGIAHPGMYPQPGYYPGPPPPAGFQGGPPPGVYPQQNFSPSPSQYPSYPTGVQVAPGQLMPVTVVTHVMLSNSLGELPGYTECPHCHKIVLTTTQYTPGLMTFLACVGIALVAWVCCFLPCCIKSCQDVKHHCPDCKKLIYKYTRM